MEETTLQLLITDDEAHVVERLSTGIDWKAIGIDQVHKAGSAKEALELLRQFSIDIVITDIQMPVMNGLQLVAEIRKRWTRTKCILLSGYSDFGYAKEAIHHQTEEYLIKPVTDEELIGTVVRTMDKLKQEWEEVLSRQNLSHTLQENLPLLKGNLLNELLQGRKFPASSLLDKTQMLGIPDLVEQPIALLVVRLEDPFVELDFRSLSLMEYAVGNMVEELMGQQFVVWHTKDSHDYLVFLLSPRELVDSDANERNRLFERAASQLQDAVRTYLKGTISVLVSGWGTFPGDSSSLYNSSISAFRKRIGGEKELFVRVQDDLIQMEVKSLQHLYEPPGLIPLLEAGRWDMAEEKLNQIFKELQDKWGGSHEHMLEVYFHISSAYIFIIHKNGHQLSQLLDDDFDMLLERAPFRSVNLLHEWSLRILQRLVADTVRESRDTRTTIIKEIRNFIDQNLADDVSLQAIANHVYLHPTYISKIYKTETGDNLSDYVNKVRMERAEYLLKIGHEKIYEIAAKLGYQRPHSFNHAFKKVHGLIPQEYRDQYS